MAYNELKAWSRKKLWQEHQYVGEGNSMKTHISIGKELNTWVGGWAVLTKKT